MSEKRHTGGCLCARCAYEAEGERYSQVTATRRLRKASGSASSLHGVREQRCRFYGKALSFTSKAQNGGDAVRNSCPVCAVLCSAKKSARRFIHDLRGQLG